MIFETILHKVRIKKLVRIGLKLGKNVHIGSDVLLDYSHCWLISIGDECTLSPRVVILAHDASTKRHLGYTKIGRVSIGRRTFIGAGAIILPGVKIGENVIVGAGSVVTHDLPDNSVAFGNPARVIQDKTAFIEKHRANLKTRPAYPKEGWTLGNGITAENKKIMIKALAAGIAYVE